MNCLLLLDSRENCEAVLKPVPSKELAEGGQIYSRTSNDSCVNTDIRNNVELLQVSGFQGSKSHDTAEGVLRICMQPSLQGAFLIENSS